MKLLALALLSAANANAADDIQAVPNDELCIAMAVGMITGSQEVKENVRPELERRSEVCAPAEMYLKIAEARLQFLNAQQQGQASAALEEQQRKSDRDARIRAAGQAWLIYQAQQDAIRRNNAPKTTTCRTFFGTTTCETR